MYTGALSDPARDLERLDAVVLKLEEWAEDGKVLKGEEM